MHDSDTPTDWMHVLPATLLAAATRSGIRWHYDAAHDRVMIWSRRDGEGQLIVDALRARRDECATYLRASRPPLPPLPDGEFAYRAHTLHEPDIAIAELPWPVLAAMIVSLVRDTLQAVRDEEAWEESIAGRDAVPRNAPRPPAPSARTTIVRVRQ